MVGATVLMSEWVAKDTPRTKPVSSGGTSFVKIELVITPNRAPPKTRGATITHRCTAVELKICRENNFIRHGNQALLLWGYCKTHQQNISNQTQYHSKHQGILFIHPARNKADAKTLSKLENKISLCTQYKMTFVVCSLSPSIPKVVGSFSTMARHIFHLARCGYRPQGNRENTTNWNEWKVYQLLFQSFQKKEKNNKK